MPKPSRHVLIWLPEQEHYELQTQGQPVQWFRPGDESAFSRWLEAHTSFAFVGQAGRLSLLKEARPRGAGYWYAYHKQGRHTRKRYLGRAEQITFARLEQEARVLTSGASPASFVPEPGAPSFELKGMLLSSKLSAPHLPSFLVERSRLLTELDAVGSYPLTLVSASAGSGKTTLLSAWVAAKKSQANGGRAQGTEPMVAWLSLEEVDDDPIRFWDLSLQPCADVVLLWERRHSPCCTRRSLSRSRPVFRHYFRSLSVPLKTSSFFWMTTMSSRIRPSVIPCASCSIMRPPPCTWC
jgi:LuxR family maltose regulon positive regulatory protein